MLRRVDMSKQQTERRIDGQYKNTRALLDIQLTSIGASTLKYYYLYHLNKISFGIVMASSIIVTSALNSLQETIEKIDTTGHLETVHKTQ
ncbi:CLUMA_CG013751, isoform A [Clunio marinus]|uniref:CLUMA_CG013751, isoform A n=1 Tax=Clunio marinus TaxID=568069 RepID=A0A1J1IL52_9DIPT|nr:CLUMA_CG013751, isoform A [Clunio marinus]